MKGLISKIVDLVKSLYFLCSLHYFPLDGVLAERLFTAFDKDRNGHIDYDEFLGRYNLMYKSGVLWNILEELLKKHKMALCFC